MTSVELDEKEDPKFLNIRKAFERCCDEYNKVIVGYVPAGTNIVEKARLMFPSGYRWLSQKEEEMNNQSLTVQAHANVCRLYIEGWTKMFWKIRTYYSNELSGR